MTEFETRRCRNCEVGKVKDEKGNVTGRAGTPMSLYTVMVILEPQKPYYHLADVVRCARCNTVEDILFARAVNKEGRYTQVDTFGITISDIENALKRNLGTTFTLEELKNIETIHPTGMFTPDNLEKHTYKEIEEGKAGKHPWFFHSDKNPYNPDQFIEAPEPTAQGLPYDQKGGQ